MRKLRVFLANVGVWRKYGDFFVVPPLGILSLAAYLRSKRDVEVQLANQRFEKCSNEELVQRIRDFSADVVGLGSLTPTAWTFAPIAQLIKEWRPETLIVLGGPHVSAVGAEALRPVNADVAIPGEGEWAFEHVLREHFDGGNLDRVPGIAWRNGDGAVVQNPGATARVNDLDSLPFPAYDLLDLPSYWRTRGPLIPLKKRFIDLFTSRGCIYQCAYCHSAFGKVFRACSAERIADEIAYFQRRYDINEVHFSDDSFNLDEQRIFELSDLLIRRNIRVRICFPNGVRSDLLTEQTIDALVAAGWCQANFALDTGSPRLQRMFGRNLDIPRFLKAVEYSTSKGVLAAGCNMLGFPTETAEEMAETARVASESALHFAAFLRVTPFPGTPLYTYLEKEQPEKLAQLRYEEADIHSFRSSLPNFSAVPDDQLRGCFRRAALRFYARPKRIIRILRDVPAPVRQTLGFAHMVARRALFGNR